MPSRSSRHLLQVEHLGAVTIIKFRRREILDVGVIEDIGEQLFKLVHEERRHHLLLNLGNIDRLSTAMVGKFVATHKKAQAATGQLALCNLDSRLLQVFELLRLTDVFPIYPDEQQALAALTIKQ